MLRFALLFLFLFFPVFCGQGPAARAMTAAEQQQAFVLKEEGNALLAKGAYEQALEKYKKSLQLNPDYIPNYYNMGTAYGNMNRKEEAVYYFNEAIKRGYDEPWLYYNMGFFHYKWGDYAESIVAYEKLLKKKPQDLKTIGNLTLAYKKAGRIENATALADYGLSVIEAMAKAYEQAGRLDEVGEQLVFHKRKLLLLKDNMAIDQNWNTAPDNPDRIIALCKKESKECEKAGYIALKANRRKEALGYFSTACGQKYKMSCAQGGFIAYQDRNMKVSEDLYQKGCVLEDKSACSDLADIFWQRGYKDAAFPLYQKACDLGQAKACGVMGDYFVKSDPSEAKRLYGLSCHLGNKEACRRKERIKAE